MIRTYSELMSLDGIEDRFEYLRLDGSVGEETFGSSRYLNQDFYRSYEWRKLRNYIIARDLGCDLGVSGREIFGIVHVHHIIPITLTDISRHTGLLLDPENLITTSENTHRAIHYGDKRLLLLDPIERKPNDTIPWR